MSDQNSILRYLHSDIVAKLSRLETNISPIDINYFWLKLLTCLRSEGYYSNASLGPIVFIVSRTIETKPGSDDILKPDNLSKYLASGITKNANTIYINYKGVKVEPKPFHPKKINNLEELTDTSEDQEEIFIFVKGNEVSIMANCRILKYIPDIFSLSPIGKIKTYLPISEYRKLIVKHHNDEILGEKGLKYWQNKSSRILIAAPEDKFRKKLANFLQNNLSDGFVEEESLNANSNDRNDIRVITVPNQHVYIIEIKWVGKSDGANYDGAQAHVKANEGLEQLHLYLKDEHDCVCGILVVYDARETFTKINWNKKVEEWDARVDAEPFFLELDPISSSTKAKNIVKNHSKSKAK